MRGTATLRGADIKPYDRSSIVRWRGDHLREEHLMGRGEGDSRGVIRALRGTNRSRACSRGKPPVAGGEVGEG